jgi:hypothetical protein
MSDRRRRDLGTRLSDAILSLQPTACWPLDDGAGPLRDASGRGWNAAVTGSPTFGVAAADPIGRGIDWVASPYATTAVGVPVATTAVTVLGLVRTTSSGAQRPFLTRYACFDIRVHSGGQALFQVQQANGVAHAAALSGAAANDGSWHLAWGTFDGTTVRCAVDAVAAGSSAALTGTWGTGSGQPAIIAKDAGTGTLFSGTLAHLALFTDRVLPDATRSWLAAIIKGG